MSALAQGSQHFPLVHPTSVIMQPTTLCNLDCSYCYLPFRRQNQRMLLSVAQSVAKGIASWPGTVEICWHGGEPLAAGTQHLGRLMDQFANLDVAHSIQTNATLINQEWLDFFSARSCHVGVSIDGPANENRQRHNLGTPPSFREAVRGIQLLVKAGHDVSAISVVSNPTPDRAERLHQFISDLGCKWLGVNIEEKEGVNTRNTVQRAEDVVMFWAALISAWQRKPQLQIREVDRVLRHVKVVLDGENWAEPVVDPLPTIAWNGDMTLISPELSGFESSRFGTFACGNVLKASLDTLLAEGIGSEWIKEFLTGIERCRATCPYFEFCGGAHPANRYFEHGRFDGTETNYCRNSKIYLIEGAMRNANRAYGTHTEART